jgi:hypothetical protein
MNNPICGYCNLPMTSSGRLENEDELGVYVAEVWQCPQCAYVLEKEPVYLDE